jgi:hypothetical protein
MVEVRLVDLDVIKRYSLVVRRDAVPADELLASLEVSREVVLAALNGAPSRPVRPVRARPRPARRASKEST